MKLISKNKWVFLVTGAIVIAIVILILIRGDEDTWIKDENGKWVRHGNPSSPAPGNENVTDYASCSAIYPIMKNDPAQCQVPNGEKYYDIKTFDECAMFFPVMETYPEQCRTNDGKSFIKQ